MLFSVKTLEVVYKILLGLKLRYFISVSSVCGGKKLFVINIAEIFLKDLCLCIFWLYAFVFNKKVIDVLYQIIKRNSYRNNK